MLSQGKNSTKNRLLALVIFVEARTVMEKFGVIGLSGMAILDAGKTISLAHFATNIAWKLTIKPLQTPKGEAQMTKAQREQQEAIVTLKGFLKPGDIVYTKWKHTSKSGMYRVVDVYVIRDNEPLRLTWSAAKAIGARYDRKHEGVGISGCGYDVGYSVVHDMSYYLFKDGFECIGDKCPSNDHANGDRDYSPHWHKSGGYALRHRWL